VQDRDGGTLLMSTLFGLFPFLLKLYADSGYQGRFSRPCAGSAGRSTSRSLFASCFESYVTPANDPGSTLI
jgi:hypothetical protein